MSIYLRKVLIETGAVRGVPAADPRVTAFRGIPFAKPPVGALRWAAPQPADPWEGELLCSEFAPISMQVPPGLDPDNIYSREWNVDPEIEMSEDCLYLNVWTPARTGNEKLPVFVWYFGGGLQVGNTAEMEFDGERIARRGVVVVTVNYRVNTFGFLAHPELTAEAPDAPTNFGHLDQQFGTQWVKRNIAAFGGDPDRITIGGQSAGGMSVTAQLASPQNEGLFQGAIVMSGFFESVFVRRLRPLTLEAAYEQGKAFFDFLGVKTLAEARALPAELIRDKSVAFNTFWGTVIDGKFQTEGYKDVLLSGRRWPVPVLVGWTNNEFFEEPKAASVEELREMLVARYGEAGGNAAADCAGSDLAAALSALNVAGPEYGGRLWMAGEERAGLSAPRYVYEFGPEMPGWDDPGAFHSSDLWFFFETLAKCWRPFTGKHYDLARQMCNYWANFIKTGDPNGEDLPGVALPAWKPYTEAEPTVMKFGETSVPTAEPVAPVMAALVNGDLK